jgi:hypothetical protein
MKNLQFKRKTLHTLSPKLGKIRSLELQTTEMPLQSKAGDPFNYNCLLHPELAATRHTSTTPSQVQQESGLENQEEQGVHILTQLNLTHGLAGSLIDSIVVTRLRDEARNGINREEIRQKKIATAKEVIAAKKKRYTAGMHAAAEQFSLGTDVWLD